MSSTNRGGKRETSDYYKTPVSSILDFLMEFDNDNPSLSFTGGDKIILDPCAGGDKDNEMSYPEALKKFEPMKKGKIFTIDIREDSRASQIKDYLWLDCKGAADVIITNPPFSHALPIIQKALNDVKKNGLVIMLVRLNFFGGRKRHEWLSKHMPIFAYVHCRRMSFTGGQTDSIEYCHMVWQKDNFPKFTKLKVI